MTTKRAFNCRHRNTVSLKPLAVLSEGRHATRRERYCPGCTYHYCVSPCPFRPSPRATQGQPKSGGARGAANPFGIRNYTNEKLLEMLVEFYRKHRRWPRNTTEYKDDITLPSSSTIKRHFGDFDEAYRQAEERMTKEEEARK